MLELEQGGIKTSIWDRWDIHYDQLGGNINTKNKTLRDLMDRLREISHLEPVDIFENAKVVYMEAMYK